MLDQRRWRNIEPTLAESTMFEGKLSCQYIFEGELSCQYIRGVSCFASPAVIIHTQRTTKSQG